MEEIKSEINDAKSVLEQKIPMISPVVALDITKTQDRKEISKTNKNKKKSRSRSKEDKNKKNKDKKSHKKHKKDKKKHKKKQRSSS